MFPFSVAHQNTLCVFLRCNEFVHQTKLNILKLPLFTSLASCLLLLCLLLTIDPPVDQWNSVKSLVGLCIMSPACMYACLCALMLVQNNKRHTLKILLHSNMRNLCKGFYMYNDEEV